MTASRKAKLPTSAARHECDLCGRRYQTNYGLKCHKVLHVGGARYRCLLCAKTFSQASSVTAHRRYAHDQKRRYECEQCGQHLSQSQLVNYHESLHSGKRDYRCSDCRKTYWTRNHLNRHRREVHERKEKFECAKCGRRYSTKGNLREHDIRTHNAVGTQRRQLSAWKSFHVGDNYNANEAAPSKAVRRYECEMCGAHFGHKHTMFDHSQRHSGQTLPCSQCTKRFHSAKSLYAHRRLVHEQPRRFACPECGTAFQTETGCNEHRFIHSGATPFACAQCPYKCRYSTNLRRHVRQTHHSTTS